MPLLVSLGIRFAPGSLLVVVGIGTSWAWTSYLRFSAWLGDSGCVPYVLLRFMRILRYCPGTQWRASTLRLPIRYQLYVETCSEHFSVRTAFVCIGPLHCEMWTLSSHDLRWPVQFANSPSLRLTLRIFVLLPVNRYNHPFVVWDTNLVRLTRLGIVNRYRNAGNRPF